MNNTKKVVLVMALILGFIVTVKAEVITIFDSNSTISGGSYDTVVIKGDGTVVDMTGGDVNAVITMNASTFNISGGNVGAGGHYTWTYDSSILNLSGGTFYQIRGHGQSEVYLSGNATQSDFGSSLISDYASVTISGNAVSRFEIRGNGKAYVTGGNTRVYIREGSPVINISGGTVECLSNNSGGAFNGVINVIGYNLNAVPYGGDWRMGEVTGYWNDDTPFSFKLSNGVYSYVKLYDGVIPPNCTYKPESDLSGDCIVNFIDFSKMANEWLDDGTQ